MADTAPQFYRSERGRDQAVYKGYGYGLDTVTQRGAKRLWRCHVKGCHGRLHTMGYTVVYSTAHTHRPMKGLKERVSHWQQTPLEDTAQVNRLTENMQQPASSLNTVKIRADLLYSSVSQAPSDQWPTLVQVLQEMMDRVVQHVTGGSISCVQIIPVDSSSFTDQLLTLHDIVSDTVSEAPYNEADKVRPCSVVVNKLNNTELLNISIEQGLSVTDIKEEVMEGDGDDTAESVVDECYTEPVTDLKKEQNEAYVPETSKCDVVKNRSASRQISYEEEEDDLNYVDDGDDDDDDDDNEDGNDAVLDDSDGVDDDTLADTTWPTKRARRVSARLKEASSGDDNKDNEISDEEWKPKTRARKAKNPRRRTPSTQQVASPVSSDEEAEPVKSENKFTPRRNRFLVAEQYENYELSAKFEDTVQNKCFLCPADRISRVDSLEAFIEHLTDANHLEYKRVVTRVLRCPICRVELRNRASERDGPEKIQILRLAGKVLQHMEFSHGFETEGAFLCQYQCDKCVYTTYGVGNFVEHVIHGHKGDANPVEAELPVARTSSVVSLEKYEAYDVKASFSYGVNAICPFCPLDTAYKAETLLDFISHLREQKHILDVDEASYSLTCGECQLEVKSTGHLHRGTDENRVLRLVGNAVNHMTTNHAYHPEEGFIPKYQCDSCTTNTYDCKQFIDHCVKVHGAKEELLEKRGMRDRITDEQLKAYLPSNFDEPFEESVDTQCPYCPNESKYKSHSLSDFLKHVRDAEHLLHGEGALYSMSCPSCDKVHKCRIYQMSDMQVLRVVGRVIQHQIGKHDLKVSNVFIPQYHCDQCSHAAYSYMDFRDHIRRLHYKHTQGSSAEEDEAPVEEEKSDEEGLGGFSKFPERHISMSRPFAKDIDTSCPFCKPGNVYKPKTMADFIQHVYKAEHLSVDRSYRYIQCSHCDEKLKSRVFINFGKKSTQTLRVIGKAAHHMYVAHGTRFEEGFLPVYECDKCVFNSYSGEQLTDHTRTLHKKSGGKPRRFKLPTEVVNREVRKRGKNVRQDRGEECVMVKAKADMCNLHLANDIFENTQKTLLSFDETLNPELGAVCPLCDDNQVPFSNLKDFADHCTATHIQADMSFVTLDCPDCQTTLACKKYKRDEQMTLALCVIGKWADHRSKQHSWSVPNFIPKFRCQCCQDFTTYSPRACHGHIHTPGKCRKNPGDKRKLTQPCPCCGKMVSQRSFNSHVQVCSKPDSERKRTSCPICGKMFLDELAYHKSNLKHHIDIVHSDYFPHLCSICSTQFKRRNDLNRHMFMVHDINISNNVPLYCDKCDYKTLMSSHLKRHYSKHQEDASVTCHYCGKQYKTEHHLKRHIEDVHDKGTGKQYKCPQCSYVAKSKRYLQKHVRWHYYGKIGAGHWCTICNYNARFPSVLKFHMKNVHKINMDDPGAEKQAAYKSVMLKRKYKNMKLPGEMGDDLFDGSVSGKVAAIIGESMDGEEPGGMSSDDGECGEPAGHVHESSSSMVAETSVTAAMETGASDALYRSSCATQPAFTSTGPTLPTSGIHPSAQSLPDMSQGVQYTHPNTHTNPQPHHHHHGHGGEAGIQNLIPAHRPILGPMGPASVLTNPSQQGNEYLYNPQMFPGFLPSQGLPPQYY